MLLACVLPLAGEILTGFANISHLRTRSNMGEVKKPEIFEQGSKSLC